MSKEVSPVEEMERILNDFYLLIPTVNNLLNSPEIEGAIGKISSVEMLNSSSICVKGVIN